MGGYFLLATKSEYSARQIETSLRLISATTGGLTTQPFRLKRTSGYATVNGMKIRKYFVALEADDVTPSMQLPGSSLPGIQRISDERHVPLDLPLPADKSYAVARREEQRIREGRRKVKEKIKLFIMHPRAEKALEEYASNFFKKRFFDDLSAEELLFLWQHAIEDNPSVAGKIFKLAMASVLSVANASKQISENGYLILRRYAFLRRVL
jgi:hypothetical protein